jgi:hypothetical protein
VRRPWRHRGDELVFEGFFCLGEAGEGAGTMAKDQIAVGPVPQAARIASAGRDNGMRSSRLFLTRAGSVISAASISISQRRKLAISPGAGQNEQPDDGRVVIVDIVGVERVPYGRDLGIAYGMVADHLGGARKVRSVWKRPVHSRDRCRGKSASMSH